MGTQVLPSTSLNCTNHYLDIWENAFLKLIKAGSFLKELPFRLHKRTNILLPCRPSNALLWHLLLTWYCLDVCYLASVAKHVTISKVSETEFVNFYAHFLSRLTAGLLCIIIAADRKLFRRFHNELIYFRKTFPGKNLMLVMFALNIVTYIITT